MLRQHVRLLKLACNVGDGNGFEKFLGVDNVQGRVVLSGRARDIYPQLGQKNSSLGLECHNYKYLGEENRRTLQKL